jgi:hypothetical protein
LCIAGGSIKWCTHYGKIMAFLKKLNTVTIWVSNSASYYKELNTHSRADIYTTMFKAALFTMAKR